MSSLDFKQLEYAVKIAQTLSYTKAANELYVSQSSLSQSIKNLEIELGVVLFDRTNRSVRLTSTGESFIKTAKEIIKTKDQLVVRMNDQGEFKSGHIKIGIPYFRGTLLLPRILPAFMSIYPEIKITVEEGNATFLEESIIEGRIDIAIINLPIGSNQITYQMLKREQILLITPLERSYQIRITEPKSKNSTFPQTNIANFKEDPFILIKPNQRLRIISDEIFNRANFKPDVRLECRDLRTIHHLVAAGAGLAITIESSVLSLKSETRIASFSLKEYPEDWPLVVAYHRNHVLTKASKEFIRITKQVINE